LINLCAYENSVERVQIINISLLNNELPENQFSGMPFAILRATIDQIGEMTWVYFQE
jgi:hypothetical protein